MGNVTSREILGFGGIQEYVLDEIVRQYLKKRIGIDLNRGENYSGRLVRLELGVGALVLRGYWRIGGGGSTR